MPKYHRFNYTPRNYDKQKEDFLKKKKMIQKDLEEGDFDVLDQLKKRKKKTGVRTDLIFLATIFFIILVMFKEISKYFESMGLNGGIGTFLLLILLGFIFIKKSKRKNV